MSTVQGPLIRPILAVAHLDVELCVTNHKAESFEIALPP